MMTAYVLSTANNILIGSPTCTSYARVISGMICAFMLLIGCLITVWYAQRRIHGCWQETCLEFYCALPVTWRDS